MGSFIGHVVPGSFFLLFSSWWAWAVFHRYFICQREISQGRGRLSNIGNIRYKNTCSFVSVCCSRTLPLEAILKIIAIIIGIIGEIATAFDENYKFYIGNAHHMTMFFFFGVTGVIDILLHYGFPLPPNIDYVAGMLAFSMEGMLFYYHLHGRSSMDVQVHMLVIYLVVLTVIATLFELHHRFNVVPALCRVFFTIIQGTWFYQIGFILYPPNGVMWNQEDPEQMMAVILIFAWHNVAVLVILFILGTFIYFRVKSMDRTDVYHYLHPFVNLKAITRTSAQLNSDQSKSMICESDEEVC